MKNTQLDPTLTKNSSAFPAEYIIDADTPKDKFEQIPYQSRLKWAYFAALQHIPPWKHREIKEVLNDPWNKNNDPEKNDANHRFFAEYFDIVEELADNGPRQAKKDPDANSDEVWKDPPCDQKNN